MEIQIQFFMKIQQLQDNKEKYKAPIQSVETVKFFLQNFQKLFRLMFAQYCISESLLSQTCFSENQEQQTASSKIQELLQIQKQTQLIQKIISKISYPSGQTSNAQNNEEQTQNEMETSIMKRNDSMVSIYSLSCDLANYTFTHQDRLKFGSNGSKCLKEVKEKCSLETYQYLSKIVQESRKLSRSSKLREKDQQRIDFLEQQKFILHHQIQKERLEIQKLETKVLKLTKQNSQLSKKIGQINDQQKKLLRKQESLIYQRKLCNSLQKEIRQEMNRLEQLYETRELKSQRSFGSNSEQSSDSEPQEKCENISNSTIESIVEKPMVLELWKVLNKLEALTMS